MSQDNATNPNQQNKRAKVDSNASNPSESTTVSKSPKATAQAYIAAHVESLHYNVASILKKTGFSHIDLHHKLKAKKAKLEKMENDDEFYPRSTRIEFDLKASKKVAVLPDYIELQESTNVIIEKVKADLKSPLLQSSRWRLRF